MRTSLPFALFSLSLLMAVGCAKSSLTNEESSPASGITTGKSQSQVAIDNCVSSFSTTICNDIAMVPPIQCTASAFSTGVALATPLTASDVNSCVATMDVQIAACKAGYSLAQVQTLSVTCTQ